MNESLVSQLRPFSWNDLPAVVALYRTCEKADDSGEAVSEEVLRANLTVPGRDVERTLAVAADDSGALIASAYAWASPGVVTDVIQVGARIHPDHRTIPAFAGLLQWAERRGLEVYTPTTNPVEYHAATHVGQHQWQAALEGAGYQPARWFLTLSCPLDNAIPAAQPPNGITLHTMSDGILPLAIKHALDEAFLDHWNPPHFTDEQFMHWVESSLFNPDLTLAAQDSDGNVVAGLIGRDGVETTEPSEAPKSRVEVLGVRRAFRGRGLARALLCASLAQMKARNACSVELEVDADNPTGATGLYASVGFTERRRVTVHSKPVATDSLR